MADDDKTPDEGASLPAPVPPWDDGARRRDYLAALQRGDVDSVLRAFLGDEPITPKLRHLGEYLVEVRRRSVAVIGSHEAFVRHTERGELQQVVAPVRLSIHDGGLVRIPERRARFYTDNDEEVKGKGQQGRWWEWRNVYTRKAVLTYEAYNLVNQVVGCSVAQPPWVTVDGEQRANPYTERDDNGDLVRIVIAVNVAGPAPMTGNVVVVQYQLDLDPRADLHHMLSGLMQRRRSDDDDDDGPSLADMGTPPVMLMPRAHFAAFVEEQASDDPAMRYAWHWVPFTGGLGYAHNVRHPEVVKVYGKYIDMIKFAPRKAQTVARRNAMKAHPALGKQTVLVNDQGEAVVRAIGWRAQGDALEDYTRALEAVARGVRVPGIDVIEHTAVYDPNEDRTGEPELDPTIEDEREGADDLDEETQRRNALLAELDHLVPSLTPKQAVSAGYTGREADLDLEQLEAIVTAVREMTTVGAEE